MGSAMRQEQMASGLLVAFQSSSSEPCSESLTEPLPDWSVNSEGTKVWERRLLPLSEPGGIGAGAFFA